ncbi:BTBD6-like protein, partial [Mya arenaria]
MYDAQVDVEYRHKGIFERAMKDDIEQPWQYSDGFARTNLHLLENQILCDLTFAFGEDKKVRAHKNILASRSPVFYTMLCGCLPQSSEEVDISDVDISIFKEFLRYLYTKSCDVNAESATYLLYLSKKYDVPSLHNMCRVFLKKAVNVENENDLQKECLNFISRKTTKVLKSTSFLSLPPSTVECVLNEDYLNCSELNVYFALKAWAMNACKQRRTGHTNTEIIRDEIGGLLRVIRFPSLRAEDFATHVANDEVLTQEKKLALYQDIILGESMSGFPTKLRLPPNTSSRVEGFKSANDKPWSIRNQTDGISFTVSGPCRLIALILYRLIHEGMVAGQIPVYEGSNLKIDLQQSVNFAAEQITSDVMFTEVQHDPGKTYSIYQTFTGVGTYPGIEPQASHVVNEVEIQFIGLCFGRSPNETSQMMEITMQDNIEDPWQYSDDFAQTNLQLLEKELLCDIAFSFEDGKEVVRAHKKILSSRSPVFCTMVCGSLQESAAVIEIPDVDASIFKQFLSICRIFLKKAINVENVCTILGQSLHFQEDDLQKECLNFISKKTTEVFKSASFLSLQTSTVKLIARNDILNCNELDVYFALKAWAISACKQKGFDHTSTELIRAEMGGLLRLIRFPNLCVEDFSKHVAKDVVLTQEEKLAIYQDIVLSESVSGYPSKLRRRTPFVSMRIERFNSAKAQPWMHRNLADSICFTVSNPCRLLGALLYRPIHEGEVMGQLSVYEENDLKNDKQESIYFAEEKITSDVLYSVFYFSREKHTPFAKPLLEWEHTVDRMHKNRTWCM